MAIIKQLSPDEYSDYRKKALQEKEEEEKRRKMFKQTEGINMAKTKKKKSKSKKGFGKTRYCKCKICGEEKFTREDVYQARIKKFGSEEKLKKEYVCRECRRKLKENKTK